MDRNVIYVGCPHCGKGWYGRFISTSTRPLSQDPAIYELESLMIQGMNPTDLTKPIKCLNCGNTYQPITKALLCPENGWEVIDNEDDTFLAMMEEWVAERVMNTKGH